MADSHEPKSERLDAAGIRRVDELSSEIARLKEELAEVQDRAAKQAIAFAGQAGPLTVAKNRAVEQLEAAFLAGDTRWAADIFPFFNGRILLGHHKKWDLWMAPGGKMRPGELPHEAAQRELREETGIKKCVFPRLPGQAPDAPPGLLQFREIRVGAKCFLTFEFVALVSSAEVVCNDEFHELRWVTRAEALNLSPALHPSIVVLVEQIFAYFSGDE